MTDPGKQLVLRHPDQTQGNYMTTTASTEHLRAFVERIERTQAEKDDAAEAQKEVYAEAKAFGYDTATLRKVIARRKKDRDDLAEEEALLEMYEAALG